ncbi:MAG TPA: VanZ family protein, partial [Gammaproteobacteria bacterium]|nr:VanZ family protein [Gammaproteobacteria bacterium]
LLLALAWMGVIFYLSHQPSLPAPSLFEHQDKLFHVGAYGLLGLLLAVALHRPARPGRALLVVWLLGTFYGLADEFHQSFIPGRDTDSLDVLADSVGALLGGLAGALFMRHLQALPTDTVSSRGWRRRTPGRRD